jgi:hypothetical protein
VVGGACEVIGEGDESLERGHQLAAVDGRHRGEVHPSVGEQGGDVVLHLAVDHTARAGGEGKALGGAGEGVCPGDEVDEGGQQVVALLAAQGELAAELGVDFVWWGGVEGEGEGAGEG